MRLFIAVQFSKEVKELWLAAIADLKRQAVSGNFTRAENLHLTLAFIGESENVAAIQRVIDCCAVPAFELAVSGTGTFGNLFWAGIEKNPELKALADTIQNSLRKSGFQIEERAFKPHITLARQLVTKGPVSINIRRTAMTVGRVSLMKSERINGRLVYTELYGKSL